MLEHLFAGPLTSLPKPLFWRRTFGLCRSCGLRLASCNWKNHRISVVKLQNCYNMSPKKFLTALLRIHNSASEDGEAQDCCQTTCFHMLPKKLRAMQERDFRPIAYPIFDSSSYGAYTWHPSTRTTTWIPLKIPAWWAPVYNQSFSWQTGKAKNTRLILNANKTVVLANEAQPPQPGSSGKGLRFWNITLVKNG